MTLSFVEANHCQQNITPDISKKILLLLMALPHGVFEYEKENNIVQTSNNLAQIDLIDAKLRILLSQRSSKQSKNDFISKKIEAIAKLAGANIFIGTGYPAWEPNWNSKLLNTAITTYKNLFKKEPRIDVIHAGLECGIIGSKYPEMEMLSIGPTVKSPHTTQEKLNISDVNKIILFLLELFKNI
jgi:dipeptidase D